MSKRLRWKQQPKETGLAAVGAGPRGHEYHDGETVYAIVSPDGGNWRLPLAGWYYYASVGDVRVNTYPRVWATAELAKAEAAAWVKALLKI